MLTDTAFMSSCVNGKLSRVCISGWKACVLTLPCGVLHCFNLLTPLAGSLLFPKTEILSFLNLQAPPPWPLWRTC